MKIDIQPITIAHTASKAEFVIQDYVLGAPDKQATVFYLTSEDLCVKVERITVPATGTDDEIIQAVCEKLNIIML